MKPSRFSQTLVFILPIFCMVASVGIVAQQTLRRDELQQKMTAYEREQAALEKKYIALCKATGEPVPAAETNTHHHDGDGD